MRHFLTLFAALALLAVPAYADEQPSPTLTGTIALGAGTEGLRLSGDRDTSLGVAVKLRLANALGHLSLNAGVRHFLEDESRFWRGKSKLNLGFDLPIGSNAVLFADHERKYYGGESWSWAGVRVKFGPFGSK